MLLSLLLGLSLLCPIASADNSLLQKLYTSPSAKTRPEAIIFYNTANPCETCNKTINLTIRILRSHYQSKLHAYLINLAQHPEFISVFKLKGPLTLVIIRIEDGTAFGYAKLESLQSRIITPDDYEMTLTQFINNFLGMTTKN